VLVQLSTAYHPFTFFSMLFNSALPKHHTHKRISGITILIIGCIFCLLLPAVKLSKFFELLEAGRNSPTEHYTYDSLCNNLFILVPVYNRAVSLTRTLASLSDIDFEDCEVNLIFCVDANAIEAARKIAFTYTWEHGPTHVHMSKIHGLVPNILGRHSEQSDDYWVLLAEDDTVYSRFAFQGLQHAAFLAKESNVDPAGIGLNKLVIDQHCTTSSFYKRTHGCHICNQSKPRTVFGPFVCQGDEWSASTIPSSWGAAYAGWFWNLLQIYTSKRHEAGTSADVITQATYGLSNAWSESWKRFAFELLTVNRWVILYPPFPLSTTMRENGVHVSDGPYEQLARCLFVHNVAFADAPQFPNKISTPKYHCGVVIGSANHRAQTAEHSSLKFKEFLPLGQTPQLETCLVFPNICNTPRFVVISSTLNVDAYFMKFSSRIGELASTRLIVFAPASVCAQLAPYPATCIVEEVCFHNFQVTPDLGCLLGSVFKAFPRAKLWMYTNSDIVYDDKLQEVLSKFSSKTWWESKPVVLTGIRQDCFRNGDATECVDHAPWGIDYLIMNRLSIEKASSLAKGLAIGRVGWDNQLLGLLLSKRNCMILDISNVLKARHFSQSRPSKASHKKNWFQNHRLKTSVFDLGRINNIRYVVSKETFEPQSRSVVSFDPWLSKLKVWLERRSQLDYQFSDGTAYCLCQMFSQNIITVKLRSNVHKWCSILLQYQPAGSPDVFLPDSLLAMLQVDLVLNNNKSAICNITATFLKQVPFRCCVVKNAGTVSYLDKLKNEVKTTTFVTSGALLLSKHLENYKKAELSCLCNRA